ncbi:MAG TPA: hypothetical protein VHV32_14355 [Candidatus Angelobacter sp.]|nr:hypothetical protein [Candidatus Angelobacter sp.]
MTDRSMRSICFAVFILIGFAAATDQPYMAARLEKVEMTDLSAPMTIPPLGQNTSALTLQIPFGVLYKFTLKDHALTYLAACVSKAKKSIAADWIVNDPVQFRVEKAKLYLKRPKGKPLRLGLIEKLRNTPDGAASNIPEAIAGPEQHQNIPECR